ncbi:hypothetical protein, partial [Staphylococcus pasteuri_A]
IQVGIFFAAWAAIAAGGAAYSVFIVAISANILMFGVRLYLVNKLTGFPISSFLRFSVLPVLTIMLVSALPVALLNALLPEGLFWSALVIVISFVVS